MSASSTTAERRGPRWASRSMLLIGLGLLAAVLVVVVAGRSGPTRTGDLDPANPGPGGARALAQVLEDQGVDLTVVRDADALDDAEIGTGSTVVVTSTDLLGRSATDRLLAQAADAQLVIVDAGPGTTDALGLSALPLGAEVDGAVAADCAHPTYDGLSIAVDHALAYPVEGGCFRTDDGALLTQPRPGLVLLGAGDALSNEQVLRSDNAAVALRLLGPADRLVWYVPSLADLEGDDGVSLATLLPRWLRPALWLLAIASIALLLWRARRLGPLAVEPLPVTVKAIETTRSRGRLYRRAGDRAHAAAVLRAAARVRASERLRLGAHPDPDTLVRDVARHCGRPVAEIDALLGPRAAAPVTDHDLITLADQLAELDREVRRT